MGQRHQIYVKLPRKFFNKDNVNNRESKVIGIHHQWLWGRTALQMLINFLTFCFKADQYNNFTTAREEEALSLLNALYSLDVQNGSFNETCTLEDGECEDPLKGDNNNGITIIDLTDFTEDKCASRGKSILAVIKYCFMSIHHLECLSDKVIETSDGEGTIDDLFNNNKKYHLKPIPAKAWIRLHYPEPESDDEYKCEADCICIRNNDEKLQAEHEKSCRDHEVKLKEFIKFFDDNKANVQCLSLEEVKAIFPKMYGIEEEKKSEPVKALEEPKKPLKGKKTKALPVSKTKTDLKTISENNFYGWPEELYPAIEGKKMLFVYSVERSDLAEMGQGGGDFVRAWIIEQTDRMVIVKTDLKTLNYLAPKKAIKKGDRVFIGAAGFRKGVASAEIHDIQDGNLIIGSMTGNLFEF